MGVNIAEFSFEAAGDQAVVRWSLSGKYNFAAKAMGLFIDMDQMIGRDFATGLARLKSLVESASVVTTSTRSGQ
jgi:hypothetical protein